MNTLSNSDQSNTDTTAPETSLDRPNQLSTSIEHEPAPKTIVGNLKRTIKTLVVNTLSGITMGGAVAAIHAALSPLTLGTTLPIGLAIGGVIGFVSGAVQDIANDTIDSRFHEVQRAA